MGYTPWGRQESDLPEQRTHTRVIRGFPDDSEVKNPANAGDVGSTSGSGRSPGEGNHNLFQYWKSHGQKSLADYSPWGHKAVGVVNTIYLSLKVAKSRMSTIKKIDNNKC